MYLPTPQTAKQVFVRTTPSCSNVFPRHSLAPPEVRYDWTQKKHTPYVRRYDWMSRDSSWKSYGSLGFVQATYAHGMRQAPGPPVPTPPGKSGLSFRGYEGHHHCRLLIPRLPHANQHSSQKQVTLQVSFKLM